MTQPRRPPLVTVLMPVHDGAPFLRQAIDSVLHQTLADFELLVIDDGSTDDSAAIAVACAAVDPRVRVDRQAHAGLVAALNRGLDTIDSELIARADADDVNHPDRLALQVALLSAHPTVGACGSAVRTIPGGAVWTLPESPDALRALLLFGPPLYHPTAMMRRDWMVRSGARYDPAFVHAEDYDLWERAARETQFANLSAPLVDYRRHSGQISERHYGAQMTSASAVRRRQLLALGLAPTADDLALHEDLAVGRGAASGARLADARRWLEGLRDANLRSGRYPPAALEAVLATRWYRYCVETALDGVATAAQFAQAPFARTLPDVRRRVLNLHIMRVLPAALSRRIAARRPTH
ncbi:MAG: glycosyltransferase family 2 protein [Candidatus Binatia bacterium]